MSAVVKAMRFDKHSQLEAKGAHRRRSSVGVSRRQFLSATATGALAVVGAPAALTTSKTDSKIIIGEGDYRYEVIQNWPQLPSHYVWQTTQGIAIDKSGYVYVFHMGDAKFRDYPSIFVFDPDGKYVRSFGQEFHGGGHGIEVRQEGSDEYLYVCSYRTVKNVAKLDLKGNVVWKRSAPMESGIYAVGEDINKQGAKGRDKFQPTNLAFLDDGGFLLADGYGSFYIHRYDRDGKWISKFGGPGAGEGTFDTPHGLWIDRRPGRESSIVVCDRAHNTLQYFTMDGEYRETLSGFGLPANIDTWRHLMVVPELDARVSILDDQNRIVARLGDDAARIKGKGGAAIRNKPEEWINGKFVHPHDACFAADGSIFVAEWVATGRISKLKWL